MLTLKFVKNDPRAVTPSKAHPSDIGWDLTAISIKKVFDNGVVLYDTGISVCPPDGYYTEILPRSSISKTDMTLANGTGVIDPNYRGNLLIAVRHMSHKFNPDIISSDSGNNFNLNDVPIEPFCKFQLIVRKSYQSEMMEVENFNTTDRGDGGFGSSDAK